MPGPHSWIRDSTQAAGENLGPYLNRVIWSLAALSGLFLGLRLFSKLWRHRALWWDDYVLIASWVRALCCVRHTCENQPPTNPPRRLHSSSRLPCSRSQSPTDWAG